VRIWDERSRHATNALVCFDGNDVRLCTLLQHCIFIFFSVLRYLNHMLNRL
jgi:hypothetical protein